MPGRRGADHGVVIPVAIDEHLTARRRPEETQHLHGGGGDGGGEEDGAQGAGDAVHDHLHPALIGADAQRHLVGGVAVREDPLFLREKPFEYR